MIIDHLLITTTATKTVDTDTPSKKKNRSRYRFVLPQIFFLLNNSKKRVRSQNTKRTNELEQRSSINPRGKTRNSSETETNTEIMPDAVSVLQDWSRSGKLPAVSFGDDDGTVRLGDVSLRAADPVEVVRGDKSCRYSVGSIVLQLLDVNQSLLAYRKACKKHRVKDAVKASDKTDVLAFFSAAGGEAVVAAAAPAADPAPAAAAPPRAASSSAPPPPSGGRDRDRERHHDRKRHRSSSERDKHRRDSKKRDHRSRSSSRHASTDHRREKTHKAIDPKMLFSNLSVVVAKREIKAKRDAEQAKLHDALSTEGFGSVPPEALAAAHAKDWMSHEIPVGNSASILKAGAGKDLSEFLKLYNDVMSAKSSSSSGRGSSSGAASANGKHKSWRSYLVKQKPIIVLPKGMTAPITLVNGHRFLGESRFVPRDTMQKELRRTRQAPKTSFKRKVHARLGGRELEYELMDNPRSKLHTRKDWDRVVAVVALGQAWQFKDWPDFYSNPVTLFEKVFGFYIGMEGDNVSKELLGWQVTRAKLNRDKRGLDSVAYASFWNALDNWMAIHKPELLPQAPTE